MNAQVNGIPGGDSDLMCGWRNWNNQAGEGGKKQFAFDPARHGRNYNLLFCDGHVAPMNPWVLFDPVKTASIWNYDHQPHPELWVPE